MTVGLSLSLSSANSKYYYKVNPNSISIIWGWGAERKINENGLMFMMSFPDGSDGKNPSAVQEIRFPSLGWEDPLEKEMATHSSILAWRIPWTEEPGRLQSMRLQRVGYGHGWIFHTTLRRTVYHAKFSEKTLGNHRDEMIHPSHLVSKC